MLWHFRYKQHGQSSGLSSVVPFVPFGCSSRSSAKKKPPSSVPQTLHSTKKNSSSKKQQLFFFRCSFLSSHGLYPSFGRAYASTIPLHFVTVIRSLNAPFHFAKSSLFPFSTFQPYYVCRPQCFQRLLLRPAIGVGSVPWKTSLCPKSRYTAKKRRLFLIFSPPFHAAIPTFHFTIVPFHSRSSVAVRLPQHRHCAPQKK